DLRESRRDEILYAQKLLAQGQAIKPGLEPFFDSRGHLRTAQLTAAEEFDGYSCLFSTRSLPLDQMLSLYFNKDIIEKAFRSLKGIIQRSEERRVGKGRRTPSKRLLLSD